MNDGTKELSVSGVPVLTGIDNFFAWHEAIEAILVGIRAFDIARGTENQSVLPSSSPSSSDVRLSESWKDRNAKAMAYIRRTVSVALKSMMRDLPSAASMWKLLAELHYLGTPEDRGAINRKFAALFLDEGGDMVEHLNSFMELVAEASAVGITWGSIDREKCDRFLDTLPHSLRVVRTDWRQLPKGEQTFFSLVRIYNEENASRKHTAERTANAMAMAAMQKNITIKGTAAKARGGKTNKSNTKSKSSTTPSSTTANAGTSTSTTKSQGGGKSGGQTKKKRTLCFG